MILATLVRPAIQESRWCHAGGRRVRAVWARPGLRVKSFTSERLALIVNAEDAVDVPFVLVGGACLRLVGCGDQACGGMPCDVSGAQGVGDALA
jgi:hypothetical protein